MSDSVNPILAADGTPLKKKLGQALFRSRVQAFGLVVPLLAFVIVSFIVPIVVLLWQGIHDSRYAELMPGSTLALSKWDGITEPTEEMYSALVADLIEARKQKTIGKVATRVNRELSGTRSL
ncbi:MAG: ABC transporter permease, partial [Albidovulum sp.]|nr:ABC transporter permease [Albidovulum sp.]